MRLRLSNLINSGLVFIGALALSCAQNKPNREIPPIVIRERFCSSDHSGGLSPDSTTFTMTYSSNCDSIFRDTCIYDMTGERNNVAYAFKVGEKLLCTFSTLDTLTKKWKVDTTYRKPGLDLPH